MRHSRANKKDSGPQVAYNKVTDTTLSLNASNYLPKMPFIDPIAVQMPIKGYLRQRIILENMTRQIKKNPLPIMMIAMGVIFAAIAVSILWSSVLKPYIESQQDFEIRKLEGNLTSADKPPSLFDFKLPSFPGIGGAGRPPG